MFQQEVIEEMLVLGATCFYESKRLGETLYWIYSNYKIINIIRPFNVYGPGMKQKDYGIFPNFISNLLTKKSQRIRNWSQTRLIVI